MHSLTRNVSVHSHSISNIAYLYLRLFFNFRFLLPHLNFSSFQLSLLPFFLLSKSFFIHRTLASISQINHASHIITDCWCCVPFSKAHLAFILFISSIKRSVLFFFFLWWCHHFILIWLLTPTSEELWTYDWPGLRGHFW